MIIGIDASRANRAFKSGTEWYSYNLILELSKIDSKNRYFLYTPNRLKGELAHLPQNFCEKVLSWPPKYLWTMIRLSFEMTISPPDLLFVPAHIIPKISPKCTVTTIMDVGFRRYPALYTKTELKYHNYGLAQALKKATKIITISNFTKNEIISTCNVTDPSKIIVIYLGFSPKIFNKEKKGTEKTYQILAKYGLSKNIPYILYIGRLEKKKNTLNLVKSFIYLKEKDKDLPHKLVLVGKPGFGYDEIKKTIIESRKARDIIETGWVSENDLSYILASASLFVFPSFYEGFGIPLLEAMATGVPVVASRVASIPEICDNSALFFDPYSLEDIAGKIYKLIKDDNLRQTLTNLGIKRAQNFSWAKCAQKTLEVFNSC